MNNLIYIIVPISIIAINGPLIKSYYRQAFLTKNNTKKIPLRKDICFLSKKNKCPMTSYKQCTNNIVPTKFCDCSRSNYELCPHINKDNNNQIAINNLPMLNNITKIKYPKYYPRVNMYNSNKSSFNILK